MAQTSAQIHTSKLTALRGSFKGGLVYKQRSCGAHNAMAAGSAAEGCHRRKERSGATPSRAGLKGASGVAGASVASRPAIRRRLPVPRPAGGWTLPSTARVAGLAWASESGRRAACCAWFARWVLVAASAAAAASAYSG